MERRDAARSLSLIVSCLVFIYHAATAWLCTYLPSDPLYVSVSVSGYAWYGCVLSMIGVAGSIRRTPTLLTIFSNHLLIDTVLSLVPKLGLLYLFHDLTSDLCITSLSTSFWLPTQDSSLHGPGRVMLSPAPSTTTSISGTSTFSDDRWTEATTARRQCELGVSVARVLLLVILVLWTTAQWGLGLYIRRYAVRLEISDRVVRHASDMCHGVDEEKAFYEEDSLADGYADAVKAVQDWSSWQTGEKQPFVDEKHITV